MIEVRIICTVAVLFCPFCAPRCCRCVMQSVSVSVNILVLVANSSVSYVLAM